MPLHFLLIRLPFLLIRTFLITYLTPAHRLKPRRCPQRWLQAPYFTCYYERRLMIFLAKRFLISLYRHKVKPAYFQVLRYYPLVSNIGILVNVADKSAFLRFPISIRQLHLLTPFKTILYLLLYGKVTVTKLKKAARSSDSLLIYVTDSPQSPNRRRCRR